MTTDEFIPIGADMQARWWAFPIPPSALDQYVSDLADLDAEHVAAAIAAHAAAGESRPPTAGQIRRRVAELQLDAPSWDEARTSLATWWRGRERRQEVMDGWECPEGACDGDGWVTTEDGEGMTHCPCRPAYLRARRGWDELPPLVVEFIAERHIAGEEIRRILDLGDATTESQVRERWRQFIERVISSRVLAGLPGAPGLPRLEAARAEDAERRGGGGQGELHRFKPAAFLERGTV